MQDIADFIAQNRFGLGAGSDEDGITQDPRGWVTSQITPLDTPSHLRRFRSSRDILTDVFTARRDGQDALRSAYKQVYKTDFTAEVLARAQHMARTTAPFAERMVLFWSNHFTVSTVKRLTGAASAAYEREAIRPHVFGRFGDMLRAVCLHPVMLSYLDNSTSIAEGSRVGQRKIRNTGAQKTLNENLAREILELHTLGVDGGYGQNDVMELARAISGWSHGGTRAGRRKAPVHGGFQFITGLHEPGERIILGKTYTGEAEDQGLAVLDDLARHPATAQFIATKLVRHFVADAPPPDAVDRIARVFRDTDGDLAAVAHALVDLDQAWQAPTPKIKSHYEYLIAVYRALGTAPKIPRAVLKPLRALGQVPFAAPSPAGWGDEAHDWLAPEALMRRIEWVRSLSGRVRADVDPQRVLESVLGPVAQDDTRLWVSRAPSTDHAIALILASPEFQRR